jgi:Holliday junction resolvase
MTERETQRRIVDALRKAGCLVCVTSNRRHTANTPGTPDLFVWHAGKWTALEVKSPSGKLTAKQSALTESGAVHVVRSVEDALFIVLGYWQTRQ